LLIPVGAFVTFEGEEGLQRFLSLPENKHQVTILGKKPQIEKAPEPTNIIWENREITTMQRILRFSYVLFLILILLAISFLIIVTLKKASRAISDKYQISRL